MSRERVQTRTVVLGGVVIAVGIALNLMVLGLAPRPGGQNFVAQAALTAPTGDLATADQLVAPADPVAPDATSVDAPAAGSPGAVTVQEPTAAPVQDLAIAGAPTRAGPTSPTSPMGPAVPAITATPATAPGVPSPPAAPNPVAPNTVAPNPVAIPSGAVTPAATTPPATTAQAPAAPTATTPPTTPTTPPTTVPAAAPTTITTAPASALAYPEYTTGAGARVVLRVTNGSSIEVQSVTPTGDWVYRIERNGPQEVKVTFFSPSTGRDAEWTAKFEGSRIKVEN